jgi:membrane protein required for colicin V production
MTTIDWIFAGLVIILAVRCFVRGFVREILSVASYAIGLLFALLATNYVITFAAKNLGTGTLPPSVQYIVAFIICFLVGFLIMKLIEHMIREGLEVTHLELFDRVLGLGLGIVEGFALVGFVLTVMEIQPFFKVDSLLAHSLFGKMLLPLIGPAISGTIKPALDGGGGTINLGTIFGNKKK